MRVWDFGDCEFVAVWKRIPVAMDAGFRCDMCQREFSESEECTEHILNEHPMPTIVTYEGRA